MATDSLDRFLQIDDRARLCREVQVAAGAMGPAQTQRLLAHARALAPAMDALRLGVVHTYTSDLLDPWLELAAALQGLDLHTYHAPYGLALQQAQADSALVAHRPDITLLMLRREDLHPELVAPVVCLDAEAQQLLREQAAARLLEIVALFRAQPVGHLVVTLLPSLAGPALGLFDIQSDRSEAAWWSAFKAGAAGLLRERSPSTLFLDLDEVVSQVGRQSFFDYRFWHSASYPFAAAGAWEFARRIASVAVVLKTPKAKVIVLDADNTLWGGVVGEDGFDGIALGAEYPGKAFVQFQRRLLALQQRGFLLAMCSKNNEQDVQEVLTRHPHQVLRDEHFAAKRVNWVPKPDNLESLARELNLGLDSFIFVDDSDHECAAVRHRLPQVEVVQVPKRVIDVPSCLDAVARLEVLSLTQEDLEKTRMYSDERRRKALLDEVSEGGEGASGYLKRLGMRMTINLDPSRHVTRLSQLSGKTNQFNLTTRRYSEQQVQQFIDSEQVLVADFSLADTFGDSGIVGLAIMRLGGDGQAELDTFLMSCRVIGREAEGAFMHALMRLLAERGVSRLVADYLPTAKNQLAREYLSQQGFVQGEDGRFRFDLTAQAVHDESYFPITIELKQPVVA